MATEEATVVLRDVADGIVCALQVPHGKRCAHARVEACARNGAGIRTRVAAHTRGTAHAGNHHCTHRVFLVVRQCWPRSHGGDERQRRCTAGVDGHVQSTCHRDSTVGQEDGTLGIGCRTF